MIPTVLTSASVFVQRVKMGYLHIVPWASSIQYGANSPENAVTNTRPPLSSTVPASSVIFSLWCPKPIFDIRNLTPLPATAMDPSSA